MSQKKQANPSHKQCRRCKTTKEVGAFCKQKMRIDGVSDWCKACYSAHTQLPEIKARRKQQVRARYLAKKAEYHAQSKAWRLANPERTKEIVRNSMRRLYQRDPFRFIERAQIRRLAYTDGQGIEPEEWMDRLTEFHLTCAYCLKQGTLTMEHMLPISRGGQHLIENVIPACGFCNSSKGTLTLLEFVARSHNLSFMSEQQAA